MKYFRIYILYIRSLWIWNFSLRKHDPFKWSSKMLAYCRKLFWRFLLNVCNLWRPKWNCGTRGGVVGWRTMLQVGRLPVRVPGEVEFFNWPNPCNLIVALGPTKPLTEISIRNLPGGKKRPARRATNLAAICEPNFWTCGSLNLSQNLGASTACTDILTYLWSWAILEEPLIGKNFPASAQI
jgi:hypothetical protein